MDRAMIKRSVSSMVGGVPLLTIGGCGAQSGSDGRTGEVIIELLCPAYNLVLRGSQWVFFCAPR